MKLLWVINFAYHKKLEQYNGENRMNMKFGLNISFPKFVRQWNKYGNMRQNRTTDKQQMEFNSAFIF